MKKLNLPVLPKFVLFLLILIMIVLPLCFSGWKHFSNSPPKDWIKKEIELYSIYVPPDWSYDNEGMMLKSPNDKNVLSLDDWLLLRSEKDSGGSPLSGVWIAETNYKGEVINIVKSPPCENRSNFTTQFESGYFECNDPPYGIGIVFDVTRIPVALVDKQYEKVGNRYLLRGFTCLSWEDTENLPTLCEKIVKNTQIIKDNTPIVTE